jgi:glycosyltransferase involved in cell wall biosynthesis
VSVVTPTLNQAPFLEAALRSVRAQSYGNIEHIVVDGGSTDGTLDLLRAAAPSGASENVGASEDGRLRWSSGPDEGMYDAIDRGLALTTGEVIAYLNSDDAYLPWAVETVVRVFERRKDVDLVFGDGIKFEEETGAQRLRLFPPFDRVSLANYESLMQPSVFWRRSLHERIGGFDNGMRFVADLDYWLRAAAAGAGIAHVNEVLAIERIHAGRLSSAQKDAMAAEDQSMRARHAGESGGPKGRKRAAERDSSFQVLLFRRFLIAAYLRRVPIPLPYPWKKFLKRGEVKVRRRKVWEGSKPYQRKALRNAVVSALAARVMHGEAPGPEA